MKKVDLNKFDNKWYNPGNKFKRILWYLFNRVFLKTYFPYPSRFKVFILKIFGAKIGKNIVIKPNVNIKYPWFLEIGNNVWIGEDVWIDNLAKVAIGDNVCISQGAYLLTGNHNYKKETFDLIVKEIIIERWGLDWRKKCCMSWCKIKNSFNIDSWQCFDFGCGRVYYLSRKSCKTY